ncbi:MAG TPA: WYL domain-containing protein [Stellaceae bacterium]|jgi:predicted DNA-binding transcriptional regulator YafY|nr:WYL domain-containing protein [Stellaceae bacterium]
MRASRLLSILMLLQAKGRISAPDLAAELEVSLRTIYRDIDELSAASVPVYAERGRAGGFQLLDGWRTRLTGLTALEAQALFLAGLPGPAAELGLAEVMEAAQLKLLAALPAGWQGDASRIGARFHLDPVGWFRGTTPVDHLPTIAEAVWNERRLKIRYESWSGIVDREIAPLGLVLKSGIWYLAAAIGDDRRTYRLSNIRELSVLAEGFTRPPDFDLAEYWAESTRRFETEIYRDTATLRVSPRGVKLLREASAAVAKAAARSAEAPDGEGWTRLVIPIESIDHAAQELARLGAEAEVLAPAPLRARIGETARRLAALYATGAAGSDADEGNA